MHGTGISLAVDDDDHFELMIRNALKPTPNASRMSHKLHSTHPTARRVLVVHASGGEEVVGKHRCIETYSVFRILYVLFFVYLV